MSESPLPRRLVTIDQAAEYLHCHRSTIRRRLKDGTLAEYRLGNLIRIDADELDRTMTGAA